MSDGRLFVFGTLAAIAAAGAVRGSRGVVRGGHPRVPPSRDPELRQVILEAAARYRFADAWGTAMEEAGRGREFARQDLLDIAPETNAQALQEVEEWVEHLEEQEGATLDVLYERAAAVTQQEIRLGARYDDPDSVDFGHDLIAEAVGSGVSWGDDHAPHGLERRLPYLESMWHEDVEARMTNDGRLLVLGTLAAIAVAGAVRGSRGVVRTGRHSRRYVIEWYVTDSAEDAERLALKEWDRNVTDGSVNNPYFKARHPDAKKAADIIKVTDGVFVTHLNRGGTMWALWSDGKVTSSIGLSKKTVSENPTSLSPDAVGLVSSAYGSDSGCPKEGWDILTRVVRILSTEELSSQGGGHFAGRKIEHLTVQNVDGSIGNLYIFSVGYSEGYAYDVFTSREALDDYIKGSRALRGARSRERGARSRAPLQRSSVSQVPRFSIVGSTPRSSLGRSPFGGLPHPAPRDGTEASASPSPLLAPRSFGSRGVVRRGKEDVDIPLKNALERVVVYETPLVATTVLAFLKEGTRSDPDLQSIEAEEMPKVPQYAGPVGLYHLVEDAREYLADTALDASRAVGAFADLQNEKWYDGTAIPTDQPVPAIVPWLARQINAIVAEKKPAKVDTSFLPKGMSRAGVLTPERLDAIRAAHRQGWGELRIQGRPVKRFDACELSIDHRLGRLWRGWDWKILEKARKDSSYLQAHTWKTV